MKRKQGTELEIGDQFKYEEYMKADMVESVAGLLKALVKGDSEAVSDSGASLLILAYLLCQCAGVDFKALENRAKWKIGNSLEEMQDDNLRELYKYLNSRGED